MMKKLKSHLIGAILIISLCMFAFAACTGTSKLMIDCPKDTILAEIGTYNVPTFDVVDSDGVIQTGYNVTVKSVTDPDGTAVTMIGSMFEATKVGVYTIIYTADDKAVEDGTLKVDFARRNPPVVNMPEGALPTYYVRNFVYRIPAYTISNSPDMTKCYDKVMYKADANATGVEVKLGDNSDFRIENSEGFYEIVVHAENSSGISKDYAYSVPAIGPKEIVEDRIMYFDEQFGDAQVDGMWGTYTHSYTTEKAFGDEKGSLKVVTRDKNDYLFFNRLLITDVSQYTHLVFNVFNASDIDIVTGFAWFGDTVLKPNKWTEVKISVDTIDIKAVNAKNEQAIKSTNITGLSFRLFPTAANPTLKDGSTLYVSNVNGIIDNPAVRYDDIVLNFGESVMDVSRIQAWKGAGEYSTEKKFETEKGSYKFTKDATTAAGYIELQKPIMKDLTTFDYLVYRALYTGTKTDITAGIGGKGDVKLVPNTWAEIKVPVSDITSIKDIELTDITGLTLNFAKLADGESIYVSSLYAGINGMIMDFGRENVMHNSKIKDWYGDDKSVFTTEKHFGNEAGSYKFTAGAGSSDRNIECLTPMIKDVTSYNYVIYRVLYTGSATTVKAGYKWCGETTLVPNEWTEVKVAVAGEGGLSGLNPGSPTNLTSTMLRFQNLPTGEFVYISSMIATHDPLPVAPEVRYDDILLNFGEEAMNVSFIETANGAGEYSTEKKFETETGSYKFTKGAATAAGSIKLKTPIAKNVTAYDYLVYRVFYTGTKTDITAAINGKGAVTLAANAWTEVKVALSDITGLTLTDITGLTLDFAKLADGETVYVSNLYAGIDGMVIDFGRENISQVKKVKEFSGAGAYSTEKKFETETGSYKFTASAGTPERYLELQKPMIKDVSSYDYIIYRVFYTGSATNVVAGYKWCGDKTLVPNTWTEVKVAVTGGLKEISPATLTSIAGLVLRFQNLPAGDVIYISNLIVINEVPAVAE